MDAEKTELMSKEIFEFVDDIEEAIDIEPEFERGFDRIIICGMGGSGAGGDIIADYAYYKSDIPVTVCKFPEIPGWADERTLMVISSYSGNTAETLEMYSQALNRGCQIIAATAGGKLLEDCTSRGISVIRMKLDLQPRSAMGITIGYLAKIVEMSGGPKCATEIRKLLPSLRKLRMRLSSNDSKNASMRIAKKVYGKTPVFYSTPGITATAYRWKNQFNENSKKMAFCGTLPDFNHNDIIGWMDCKDRHDCMPVFLYEENIPKLLRKATDISISSLKSANVEYQVVRISGKNRLERSLKSIMICDYASLYLAMMRDVDPIQVDTIKSLKGILAKKLARRRENKERKRYLKM